MPASITYWRDRLKLKRILIARLSRVAISFRAGPRIWACERPPTEKAPLESVLYCWTSGSVTLELAHGPAWSCLRLQGNYIRLGGRDTGRTAHFTVCGKFCEFCGKFCEFSGKIRYPNLQPAFCTYCSLLRQNRMLLYLG